VVPEDRAFRIEGGSTMSRGIRRRRRSAARPAVLLTVLLLAGACASVGPKTIPRDQFDYGEAIGNSIKEQLLFNVVRLRYLEAPIFVNVSSVINQYSLEGDVALGAGINNSFVGEDSLSVGGGARYADRPTITYSPVAGKEFAASLLTPISPQHLFALVQAGWPAEAILRLTVRSINGIENEAASIAGRKQADPRFAELLRAWSRLQRGRAIGLRREGDEDSARIIVYRTAEELSEEAATDLAFLMDALELDEKAMEYRLSYGLVPDESNEIVVMTNSIILMMAEMAWRMEVPPEHIEEGRTRTTFVTEGDLRWPLIRIHYSEEKPEDAYVSVRNRGYWFYIDDTDVYAKRTFALMQIMLSLTDEGESARGPVVSLTN
jgi:hypothetical protein